MKKFNQWYDNLEEPYRFLFFLITVAFPFSFALGDIFPNWLSGVIIGYVLIWVCYRIIGSAFTDED